MPLVLPAVASDAPRAREPIDPDSPALRQAARSGAMRAGADDSRAFCDRAETEQTRKARIGEKKTNGTTGMKAILGCAALALAVAATTVSADAKGCIKGAIVGGVAGHVAGHHGVLGAAAGCIVGHHEARSARRHCNRRTSNAERLFASPCSLADRPAVPAVCVFAIPAGNADGRDRTAASADGCRA